MFRLINKNEHTRILVHNNYEDPLNTVSDACFTNEVHRGMVNLRLGEMYGIQSYSWLVHFHQYFIVLS